MLLVQFSHSVVSYSLQPHELQHAKLPNPSLPPGVDSNSCPFSRWCHLTISSSVTTFSSCPQAQKHKCFFPMSQLFTSGSQRIGASASESVLLMSIHGWFPLGLTGLRAVQGALRSLLQNHSSKASILWCSAFFMVQLSHPYILEKP